MTVDINTAGTMFGRLGGSRSGWRTLMRDALLHLMKAASLRHR